MSLKSIFLIVIFCVSLAIISTADAQLGIGSPAQQKKVEVTIGEEGQVHVLHEVKKSNSAKSVRLIEGTMTNLQVIDVDGNEIEHGVSGGFGGDAIVTLFPTSEDVIIEYDLDKVMFQKNKITWTWHFLYLQTTTFIFPESVDLVFVNDSPVYLKDTKKFNCHGCEMILEYVVDEIKSTEKVIWEDKEFEVEIWTSGEISSFNFNQPSKSISFDFDGSAHLVTLIIPLELLWSPYQALLDDEKIFAPVFQVDENHKGISLKPEGSGNISIVGTTVIPEFPIVIPLAIGITMVIAMQFRNKINLH